jgi:hypothetical protein
MSPGVRAHSARRATQGGADNANQLALVADASDAQSAAGSYYTNAALNGASSTVDLYLARAPQSLIDRLNALHPGVYVIHNDAANPRSALLHLENSIDIAALRSQGVAISSLVPTSDGYLQVGVTSDVAAATAKLNSLYDPSLFRVVKETDGSQTAGLTLTASTRHPRAAHP